MLRKLKWNYTPIVKWFCIHLSQLFTTSLFSCVCIRLNLGEKKNWNKIVCNFFVLLLVILFLSFYLHSHIFQFWTRKVFRSEQFTVNKINTNMFLGGKFVITFWNAGMEIIFEQFFQIQKFIDITKNYNNLTSPPWPYIK